MNHRYLEITYRNGKPLAAYLYLPRRTDDKSARVEPHGHGYLVDWTEDGRPIGIEMPSPSLVTLTGLNDVLAKLRLGPLTRIIHEALAARAERPGVGAGWGRAKEQTGFGQRALFPPSVLGRGGRRFRGAATLNCCPGKLAAPVERAGRFCGSAPDKASLRRVPPTRGGSFGGPARPP